MRILKTLALCLGMAGLATSALAQDIKVRIEGAGDKGTVHLYVFSTAQGFPKEESAAVHTSYARQNADPVEAIVQVPEAEEYALMAYQDKNEDGKMNRLLGMIPQEPYALSRNPQVMGKPKFADAAVRPTAGEVIVLKLRD